MKNRKRNRMLGFDYSSDRLYFVTICVKDRVCCLASIRASGAGHDLPVLDSNENILQENIFRKNPSEDIPFKENRSKENLSLQLNVYGLIVEDRIKWLSEQYEYVEVHNYVVMPNHVHLIIEIDSLKVKDKEVKIKSLSSLVGAFKTTSSKMIHEIGLLNFAWQRSFHDHIIRQETSYQNVSNYIDLNPHKWLEDTFFETH